MQEATKSISSPDRPGRRWQTALGRNRWNETKRSVRALAVVVLSEDAHDEIEMSASEDQQPVQALPACRSHEPLGICIRPRCPRRSEDHRGAVGAKDLIEGGAELGVPAWITKRTPARDPEKLRLRACCLTHWPVGLWCSGEVDAPTGNLDQEEHVVAAPEGGLDREEVKRDEARRLPAQEVAPARPTGSGRRVKPPRREYAPNRARRDHHVELAELSAMR